MTKNDNRKIIGTSLISEQIDGRNTFVIKSSQVDQMRGQAAELMEQAGIRLQATQPDKPLTKDQLSGLRDAVGDVRVIDEAGNTINYNFQKVSEINKFNLNRKGDKKLKLPALKPGKGQTSARDFRTEKANTHVVAWADNLDKRQAWPEGKSLAGYEAWLRKNYNDLQGDQRIRLQKVLGKEQDTGHGKVSYEKTKASPYGEGMSSKSNLAVQDAYGLYGNRNLAQMYIPVEGDTLESISKQTGVAPKVILESNKVQKLKIKPGKKIRIKNIVINTEDLRGVDDADAADIAWRNWDAFEEYLFEGKDTYIDQNKQVRSVLSMENFTPQQRRAVLFDPDFAATAEAAQFKIRDEIKVNAAHKRMLQSRNQKVGGKLSKADAGLRLVAAAATGDLVGGSLAAGQLGMQHALRNPTVQRTVAKQIADLVAKRGAKTAAKMLPGLDVALSGAEVSSYLSEGKLDQAGIAALSGAIGWVPLIGDTASAALDFTNTGIDIARLDWNQKPEIVGTPTADQRKLEYQNQMIQDFEADQLLEQRRFKAPDRINVLPGKDTSIIRKIVGTASRI